MTTPDHVVDRVLQVSLANPAWGCGRVSSRLRLEGIGISSPTVQKILIKHAMGRRSERLARLEEKLADHPIEPTPEQLALPERHNPGLRERSAESSRPGELLAQGCFCVRGLKGIGCLFLHAVVDTCGSYAFGVLHPSAQPEVAAEILQNDVLPFYRERAIVVVSVTTVAGPLFFGTTEHAYEACLQLHGIKHMRAGANRSDGNGFLERFSRTVLAEFFSPALRATQCASMTAIQADLTNWLRKYNTERPSDGYPNMGLCPVEIVDRYCGERGVDSGDIALESNVSSEKVSPVPARAASHSVHLSNVDDLVRSEVAARTKDDEEFWSSPYRDIRESAHAFFQYPAMMVAVVQKSLVELITEIQPCIHTMVDPFVGAGTTLTAAMYRGLDCYGQDINPLAVLLSRTKAGPFFCRALARRTQETILAARADRSLEVAVSFPNLSKWFQERVAVELSRLRRAIQAEPQLWARRFMWVALAETVRVTGNDRTSTYKLHVRPAEDIANRDPSPIETFSGLVAQNIDDLRRFGRDLEEAGYVKRAHFTGTVEVALKDSTQGIVRPTANTRGLYDLLVTSAPYGDNTSTIPYGQHSYLPLQWIDLKDIGSEVDESFLRTTQEIDRRSLGGRKPAKLEEEVEALRSNSRALARVLDVLAREPADRTSRVAAFYRDFTRALDQIMAVMAVNSYMIWTVGNRRVAGVEIPNDRALIELLEARDTQLVTQVERRIHQKRMPSRNKISGTMSRERILVFRKSAPTGDR